MEFAAKEKTKKRRRSAGSQVIPPKYEAFILEALSHFPELKNTPIRFRSLDYYPEPYAARPTLKSFFLPAEKREYIVAIREEAPLPMKKALLKNLPPKARTGIMAHELAHITQYNSLPPFALIRMVMNFFSSPAFRREFEHNADRIVVGHGLGEELFSYATFIRNIPGYTEKRKNINRFYMPPAAIKEMMREK